MEENPSQSPEANTKRAGRFPNRKVFCTGLAVRVAGLGLVWLGDGSDSLWRKTLVVVGVVLSVGGIAVLRYLLLAKPLSALRRKSSTAK